MSRISGLAKGYDACLRAPGSGPPWESPVSPNLWPFIIWYIGGAVIYGALGGSAVGAGIGLRHGQSKRGFRWGLLLGLIVGGIGGGLFFFMDLRARGILPAH
jgi:hypothetical protein